MVFKRSRGRNKGERERIFERDYVSCLCPGKKDYVSVKLEDGRKEKVQKRQLSNLKEIYQHFVTENLALKVGFSAFAMLRPKWHVPVNSSGTQYMCIVHVCITKM